MDTMDNNTQLPQNAYVAFDALTLKDFIINRLKEESSFSDQIYEGSNLSSIIEIIAYSYHVLLFYLNQTASETTFSQANIYENMNKIVNLVGYKPTGKLTSTCNINCVAQPTLPVGNYVIRKYSFFLVDDIQYTFTKDYAFSKITQDTEDIPALNDNVILYQGTVEQYPVYTAVGNDFETFPIVVDNIVDEATPRFVSEGTISVYVKEANTNKYYEYKEVGNLYLADSFERVYDLRLNENGNYEVKFGSGVFGRKLSPGDEVIVYYILSDNVVGVISKGSINGNKLFTYSTQLFDQIYRDVHLEDVSSIITSAQGSSITFTNPTNSTQIGNSETVDDMRKNVPLFVSSNLKLATTQDYTSFFNKNLNSLVQSLHVASNKQFINEYIKYFYNISVDPNKVNRVILNQANFADSCDFNNVNVFVVPQFSVDSDDITPEYLPTSLKSFIVNLSEDYKMVSHEVVPRDPIYNQFRIGISNKQVLVPSIANTCRLVVVRENTNKIQKDILRNRVTEIIKDFFNPTNNKLGQTISISTLTSRILSVLGVKNIYTENTQENIRFNGVSLIAWSPQYPNDDISLINQDTALPFFKFPYLGYPVSINKYIEVVDE
jgi:hypothetical protein